MSDEYTYISTFYHFVNLRLESGLRKMSQNHSSMMLFLYFTYWCQMTPYTSINIPKQRYRSHSKNENLC